MSKRRRTHSSLHLFAAGGWGLMSIPTVIWWSESILWVAFMSIYAIVIAHLASYEAALAKEQQGSNG